MLATLITQLSAWYDKSLDQGGYLLVTLLMAIESSVFPLPSELVIPPAADLAHRTGRFSMAGLVLVGALGSWLGASLMYWFARLAGRPLVLRYGKYVFINAEKVAGAERWAAHYGPMGIFVSRLLPVVRHLIGLPAGIVRMDFLRYSLYTLLGSAMWCSVLCWLGVKFGPVIRKGDMRQVALGLGVFVLVLGVIYYLFVHRHMKAAKTPPPQE
jgi:membrane protein DedA with SNARE-associated domain